MMYRSLEFRSMVYHLRCNLFCDCFFANISMTFKKVLQFYEKSNNEFLRYHVTDRRNRDEWAEPLE